jgi:hypothetical protein
MDRILVPDDPENLNDMTWSSIIEAQALFEVLTKDSQEHYHPQAAERLSSVVLLPQKLVHSRITIIVMLS